MNIYKTFLTLILVNLFCQIGKSQSRIGGHINIDTTIWTPVVYMSLIDNFDQMNSMTNEMIIDKASIDTLGNFSFSTQYLPKDDHLYRIHIARRNDPPATLTIGGKDENHIFFIANRKSKILLDDAGTADFLKDVIVTGYSPNKSFREINEISSYIDSAGFTGSPIKIDLIKTAINEKLRFYADTCSNPLVSLYALYKSQFEKNYPVNQQYYNKFLKKWRNEKSAYFVEFRKKIPLSQYNNRLFDFLIVVAGIIIGFLSCFAYFKFLNKDQNPLRDLSVQERKIFALIMEGKSNKEISDILLIGLSTVKSHVNSIYSKLGINSRKAALNLNLDKKSTGT
jgi:DNA-binding CsgD family transcriptional regulator